MGDQTKVDASLYAPLSKILHRSFKGPKLIKKGIDSVHACWTGMDEWIVYFPDQAIVLEACPIDNQGKLTGPCMKPATKNGTLPTPQKINTDLTNPSRKKQRRNHFLMD